MPHLTTERPVSLPELLDELAGLECVPALFLLGLFTPTAPCGAFPAASLRLCPGASRLFVVVVVAAVRLPRLLLCVEDGRRAALVVRRVVGEAALVVSEYGSIVERL